MVCFSLYIFLIHMLMAQTSQVVIIKTKSFYKKRTQGTQMVGEDGVPIPQKPDTFHFTILEVKGKSAPVVDSLFYYGKYYNATVSGVGTSNWVVGKLKSNSKKIVWKVQPGNSLWLVEYSAEAPREPGKKAVIIIGKLHKQKFRIIINKEEELEADMVQ